MQHIFIRSNAHYYSFWPPTIRDLRQRVYIGTCIHLHILLLLLQILPFNFTEFLLTLLLLLLIIIINL